MFNVKNLIWAIYNDDAKYIHGWFSRDGDILEVLTRKIEKCNNYNDLKELLIKLENIINGISLPHDEL